jgi:flavin reductase (DIM6/NTAB) family NADH-FMN oxidoreductase RutF
MVKVDLAKSYRLLNHGPTILVTSALGGKRNVMTAAWNVPLDFDPPKIIVVIDKNTYTRELIEASGVFAINIPCVAQIDMVQNVGTSTGRNLQNTDKFMQYDIGTFSAAEIDVPLVKGCVGWLECKVIPELHNQNTYDLFIAEVVAAYADERVFSDGHWHFEDHDNLRTIHHVAGGSFFAIGAVHQASHSD